MSMNVAHNHHLPNLLVSNGIEDLEKAPASELKLHATIINGKSCNIPLVVRETLQSFTRAEGRVISRKDPVYKQISVIADRLVSGDVDQTEFGEKNRDDFIAINNAAQRFVEALTNDIRLIVIPPYPYPRKRGRNLNMDVSKQFRVVTEVPIPGEYDVDTLPAIVPILDDWRHAANGYNKKERIALIKAFAENGAFGIDFAIAFGTVAELENEDMLGLPCDIERINRISASVLEITEGRTPRHVDQCLQIAALIERGNKANLPFDLVKYKSTYLYAIDFGSVLYQKINQAKHLIQDDELEELLKQYKDLMTFCPLDATRIQRTRTRWEENIFYKKDPKIVIDRMYDFVLRNPSNETAQVGAARIQATEWAE